MCLNIFQVDDAPPFIAIPTEVVSSGKEDLRKGFKPTQVLERNQSQDDILDGFRNTKNIHDMAYAQRKKDMDRKTYKDVPDEWEEADDMARKEENHWFIKRVIFDTASKKPMAILFPKEVITDMRHLSGGKRDKRIVLGVDVCIMLRACTPV